MLKPKKNKSVNHMTVSLQKTKLPDSYGFILKSLYEHFEVSES